MPWESAEVSGVGVVGDCCRGGPARHPSHGARAPVDCETGPGRHWLGELGRAGGAAAGGRGRGGRWLREASRTRNDWAGWCAARAGLEPVRASTGACSSSQCCDSPPVRQYLKTQVHSERVPTLLSPSLHNNDNNKTFLMCYAAGRGQVLSLRRVLLWLEVVHMQRKLA
jgi:hypothetical protein